MNIIISYEYYEYYKYYIIAHTLVRGPGSPQNRHHWSPLDTHPGGLQSSRILAKLSLPGNRVLSGSMPCCTSTSAKAPQLARSKSRSIEAAIALRPKIA